MSAAIPLIIALVIGVVLGIAIGLGIGINTPLCTCGDVACGGDCIDWDRAA